MDDRPVRPDAKSTAVSPFEMTSNPFPHFSSFLLGRAFARDLADDGAVHPVPAALPVALLEATPLSRRCASTVEVSGPSARHRPIP